MIDTGKWTLARKAFWILAAAVVVILPALSSSYGMSGDEWLQMDYGKHIWNYFAGIDKQALDYTNLSRQYADQQLYGGLFDFSMEALHRLFPSIEILHLRHFFNALLTAVMMVCTGLIAFRLSSKWTVGILALLFIFFSPRIFGEGMNNPKDMPFAAGFTIAVYGILSLLYCYKEHAVRYTIVLGIGCAIAIGVRPAGMPVVVAYIVVITALYLLLNKEFRVAMFRDKGKLAGRIALHIVIAIAAGYLICLSVWPYGQRSPLSHLMEATQSMAVRHTYLRNLFEGRLIRNDQMPWYYELKWILISNPIAVVCGAALFIMLSFRIRRSYGGSTVLLLLFGALFPLWYAVYKNSTLYDTWRHMFFVYPFWVVMAALGWNAISDLIKQEKLKLIPAGIAVILLLPAMLWTLRAHPNQYVYFNETVGGLEGAYGYYETDYYQNSGLQAAHWIREHAKQSGKKIKVMSNMVGFPEYFANDSSWLTYSYGRYEERNRYDWDYYITYSRFIRPEILQDGKWPPQGVIHQIEEEEIPLCVIIRRENKEGIAAWDALQKKDYALAVQHYSNLVKQDTTDPYVFMSYGMALARSAAPGDLATIERGVHALNRAIALQPGNAQFYNELSKIYKLMGDLYNEQQTRNKANELVLTDDGTEE